MGLKRWGRSKVKNMARFSSGRLYHSKSNQLSRRRHRRRRRRRRRQRGFHQSQVFAWAALVTRSSASSKLPETLKAAAPAAEEEASVADAAKATKATKADADS